MLKQSDDIANRGEVKVKVDPDTTDVVRPRSRLTMGMTQPYFPWKIKYQLLKLLLQEDKINKTEQAPL